MRAFVLSVLASAAIGSVAAQDLVIDVTYAVACDLKSKKGDKLSVMYNGTLTDGTPFDSSYGPDGGPFSFTLGAGEVIKGWDMGLLNMCVGEKRKLTIPPEYAYGDEGVADIPPKSTLIFDTELMGITPGPE